MPLLMRRVSTKTRKMASTRSRCEFCTVMSTGICLLHYIYYWGILYLLHSILYFGCMNLTKRLRKPPVFFRIVKMFEDCWWWSGGKLACSYVVKNLFLSWICFHFIVIYSNHRCIFQLILLSSSCWFQLSLHPKFSGCSWLVKNCYGLR
jgi:hypothetical protein